LCEIYFNGIADDILTWHNEQIAKRDEMIKTQDELLWLHINAIGRLNKWSDEMLDKANELRQKINQLKDEIK
jgi:hypothetical protein